jgi:hypothetical protein
VPREPAKKSAGGMPAAASGASSGSSTPMQANFVIIVVPIWARSGGQPESAAAIIFSCTPPHDIPCTRTRTPGFSRSNSFAKAGRSSRPIAQTRVSTAAGRARKRGEAGAPLASAMPRRAFPAASCY